MRPESLLYPRSRGTAIIVTLLLVALTMAGQTFVIVTQDRTISDLKNTVEANDKHRHDDIEALKHSDEAQIALIANALTGALAEIRRLQKLVMRLGGDPGQFTSSSPGSGGGGTQPQPAALSPRPRPAASPTPRPSPKPTRPPKPSPSPTPTPTPKPTPCVLPPPLPCKPPVLQLTTAGRPRHAPERARL